MFAKVKNKSPPFLLTCKAPTEPARRSGDAGLAKDHIQLANTKIATECRIFTQQTLGCLESSSALAEEANTAQSNEIRKHARPITPFSSRTSRLPMSGWATALRPFRVEAMIRVPSLALNLVESGQDWELKQPPWGARSLFSACRACRAHIVQRTAAWHRPWVHSYQSPMGCIFSATEVRVDTASHK